MADETPGEGAPDGKEQGGGMMKTLVSGAGIFVLVLAASVIAPMINNAIYGPPSVEVVMPEGGTKAMDGGEPLEDATALPPAMYQPLEPPLVVNFQDEDGSSRYLQMTVQAMARDQQVIDAIKVHAPAIRNNFLMIIGNRDYEGLGSVEGKERLRAEMLEEARAILKSNTGEPGIEEIYFTSFVMQ